ncbi:MAG: hypothetical protein C0395_10280, partial [Gemmatimonas sp.]|nr:hypothetical protein [Gemmatimonas sp.]
MAAIPPTAPSATARARLSALLALLVLAVPAAAADFAPVFKPALTIARAAGEIDVDGRLDDAGWRGAARVDRFGERQPGDNVAPLVRTEALLAYDDDNLYVAFVCEDDPATLRATMCHRDQYGNDDAVGLLLDTFGEAAWAYEFFVNPYGIQRDLMWTSVHGEDSGFDVVWHSAARITDTGYVVEMAIPMSALRFPVAEIQSWRLDLWR